MNGRCDTSIKARRLLRVILTLVRSLRGFLPLLDLPGSATGAQLEALALALALAGGWADSGLLGSLDPD